MAAVQQRLMAESDQVAREGFEQKILSLEQQFSRERDASKEAARERDRDYRREREESEREVARMRQERAEAQRKMEERAKENANRKHFSFDAIEAVFGVIKLGLAIAGIAHVF
jgi:GTP1/Obg family GTP-binding protein